MDAQTEKNWWPISSVEQSLDQLKGYHLLQARSAQSYHQVCMDEVSIPKTCPSKVGHFKLTVMPYGLCTAPAKFQRLPYKSLEPYLAASQSYIRTIFWGVSQNPSSMSTTAKMSCRSSTTTHCMSGSRNVTSACLLGGSFVTTSQLMGSVQIQA